MFLFWYQASNCPPDWYGFGNSCYKFVVRSLYVKGLNWENARRTCLNYGGDLASVENISEMNFIYSHSSKNWRENYWIGLNDQHNESQFVWSDGTPFNSSVYNNWNSGEPNDGGGVEDCVELYLRRWNDDKCNSELGYICERPKGEHEISINPWVMLHVHYECNLLNSLIPKIL